MIWPILSIVLSLFLDTIDAEFAHHVVSKHKYQLIDKTLDLWVLIFEMIYGWINLPYFRLLLLFLFIWRLIGTFVFYKSRDRKWLLVFGNFFENIFYLIFFATNFKSLNILLSNQLYFYISFFILFILKIFQEWFIHVANLSLKELLLGKKRKWQ